MPIPRYNELMLPLLRYLSDGEEHTNQELINYLANFFNLSEIERNQRMANQNRNLLYDRYNWAKVYLRKAKLIESISRSTIIITNRGKDVSNDSTLIEINRNYLMRFPEFIVFTGGNNENHQNIEVPADAFTIEDKSPEEIIDANFGILFNILASDLIDKVKNCSPAFFEKLVVDLLVKMGYGGSIKEAGSVIGQTGDGGIDGVIKEDRLGLDTVFIQAKRWEGNVGRVEIQAFVGALAGRRSKKGVFITTSNFTQQAMQYVENIDAKVILINGKLLAELMIEYGLGVSMQRIYEIKQIDTDYFEL